MKAKIVTTLLVVLSVLLPGAGLRAEVGAKHAEEVAGHDSQVHPTEQAEHHSAHHAVQWKDLALPLTYRYINFIIFVGGLVFLTRKKVSKYLIDRRKTVSEIIEKSAERKAWAEQKYREYNARLENIAREIDEMKSSLRREGERERTEMLEEAARLAKNMRKDAELVAEAELVGLRRELRKEAIETAATVAKDTLLRLKTDEDEKRLYGEFLQELRREPS